jgi:hypothetical protein
MTVDFEENNIPLDLIEFVNVNKVTVRTDDNPTVMKALHHDRVDRQQWIDAIRKEIDMLFEQGTLEPVEYKDNTRRSRTIRMVMQLKVKRRQDKTIEKYKARGCADGSQLSNELFESFSPTVSSSALFLVLQLAIIDKMFMCSIDVVGAYLYQSYPDDALPLYMTIHPDVAKVLGLKPEQLYRVRKYLYGLPDAGRAFYLAYSNVLTKNGFVKCESDPCIFTKISKNKSMRTYVCIHVDDTFVASTHKGELDSIQAILKTEFDITVSDTIDAYLGISLTHLSDDSVKLMQPKLIDSLLKEYGNLLPARDPTAPMRINDPERQRGNPVDKIAYMRLLGSLMYVVKSRPDIAAALSYASTKSVGPTEGDFDDLLTILGYLRGTRDLGLILMSGTCTDPLVLQCNVDASYLSHADSKSHHGWTLSFGKYGCFSVKSQKQTIVATSSTHAEMRALYQLSMEIVYIIDLMHELGRSLSLPVVIFEDNQPVIDLVSELSGLTKRSKHFMMNIAYVRQLVSENMIKVIKIPTEVNPADILTKSVSGQDFRYKRQNILGFSPGELREHPVAAKIRRSVK